MQKDAECITLGSVTDKDAGLDQTRAGKITVLCCTCGPHNKTRNDSGSSLFRKIVRWAFDRQYSTNSHHKSSNHRVKPPLERHLHSLLGTTNQRKLHAFPVKKLRERADCGCGSSGSSLTRRVVVVCIAIFIAAVRKVHPRR